MNVTGVILAGGAGHRMGGQDKGLVLFRGRPMVAWVAAALAPQVDELIIVANRNPATYHALGHRVVSDLREGFNGPLAGFESALHHASHDWVLTCPTDVPLLPPGYAAAFTTVQPLHIATGRISAQAEPLFSLLPKQALPSLRAALDAGERRATRWLDSLSPRLVELDDMAFWLRDADSPEALADLAAEQPPVA